MLVLLSGIKDTPAGGFRRQFRSRLVVSHILIPTMKLRAICGATNENFWYETDTAGNLLQTDSALKRERFINLPVPKNDTIQFSFNTYVDSNAIYIMAGNIPAIFIYSFAGKSNLMSLNINFTRSVVLPANTFVFRAFKKILNKWEQQFIKVNARLNTTIEENNVSDRRGDAGISTDGLLHYDPSSRLMVYVSYYSNKIICIDTSLRIVYTSHTIDKFSHYPPAAVEQGLAGSSTLTNRNPMRNINFQSCVANGKVYVNSAIISDNESTSAFHSNAVIDMYTVTTGTYAGSFYIPSYKGERVQQFKIYSNKVIALYENFVVLYHW